MQHLPTLPPALKRYWYIALLLLLLTITILLRVLTPQTQEVNPLTVWQGITPGTSTLEELHAQLGPPKNTYSDGGSRVEEYAGQVALLPNEVVLNNNIVEKIVIRDIPKTPQKTLDFLQTTRDSPELIRYVEGYEFGYQLSVYASLGVAAITHNGGEIVQVWLFPSMTPAEFLQSVGKDTRPEPVADHPFLDEPQ